MANKTFVYEIGCATVQVEAEEDGAARYMVRMSIPGRMARVRIGYLTGARRTWLAEFYGRKRCPISASSAKEAFDTFHPSMKERTAILGTLEQEPLKSRTCAALLSGKEPIVIDGHVIQ